MMNEQITLSPELEARVHQAVEIFMQGYGCCQSVVAAFADLYGLDDEVLFNLSVSLLAIVFPDMCFVQLRILDSSTPPRREVLFDASCQ